MGGVNKSEPGYVSTTADIFLLEIDANRSILFPIITGTPTEPVSITHCVVHNLKSNSNTPKSNKLAQREIENKFICVDNLARANTVIYIAVYIYRYTPVVLRFE